MHLGLFCLTSLVFPVMRLELLLYVFPLLIRSSPICFGSLFFGLCYCREVFWILFRIHHKPVLVDVFLPAINDPDQRQLVQDGTGV